MKKLLNIIDMVDEEKHMCVEQMMSSMKQERVLTQQEIEENLERERESARRIMGMRQMRGKQTSDETMSKSTEPPRKRPRSAESNRGKRRRMHEVEK